jgi:hypothetical protein
VEDAQPCLFGVRIFKLRSAASRFALVQHGRYGINHELHPDVFVRFVNHDDRVQIHRSDQGFRNGWLMFLGVPLDYRNEQDLVMLLQPLASFTTGIIVIKL